MVSMTGILEAIAVRLRSMVALRRARATTLRNLGTRPIERVLVICHGNIYRSPFVAELLRGPPLNLKQVRSAGFHTKVDRESPVRHQAMSMELGVSLQDHRSSLVRTEDLQWADIIVLMDRYNWVRLDRLDADPGKIVWMGALTDGPIEIPDPYHLGDEDARKVLARLKEGTERLTRLLDASNSTWRATAGADRSGC
jgi:protein-tyrosine phosphatase